MCDHGAVVPGLTSNPGIGRESDHGSGYRQSEPHAGGRALRAASYAGVIERFLSHAALRTERIIAWIRLALVLVNATRVAGFFAAKGLLVPDAKLVVVFSGMLVSATLSVVELIWLRPGPSLRRWLLVSVVADGVMATVVIGTLVFWPMRNYQGLIWSPEIGVFVIIIVASGMRLSRTATAVGSTVAMAGILTLLVLDQVLNGPRVDYGFGGGILVISYCLAACGIAYAIAHRTRRLLERGAQAAVESTRAREHLGAYLPRAVAEAALSETHLGLDGKRLDVAVLFSDLRGFTSYGEQLPPEQLVAELNAYLDAMMGTIADHGGIIDKFIGDSIMAVFGVPSPAPDDAARAIRAAHAMQTTLAEHNRHREALGRPPLKQGIGVHHGPVAAGNIGNRSRLQFTVIGDTVNIASRLEAHTKEAGTTILISEAAVESARRIDDPALPKLRFLRRVRLPGHRAELGVYGVEDQGDEGKETPAIRRDPVQRDAVETRIDGTGGEPR